ncbi:MAG: hypothetical protein WED34_19740 [Planctomycetales bacterium]
MDRATFVDRENWRGSYYELAIELGPAGDDERLVEALRELWSHCLLRGPWTLREKYPGPSHVPDAGASSHHLYGIGDLGRIGLGCVSHVLRENDGSDWLDLCIPMGMLELAFPVRHPLEYEPNAWIHRVDYFFARIAHQVYSSGGFRLALIGEEVSGAVSSATIADSVCDRQMLMLLPESLWNQLSPVNCRHASLADGLMVVDCRSAGGSN